MSNRGENTDSEHAADRVDIIGMLYERNMQHVIDEILVQLDYSTLVLLSAVSKRWRNILSLDVDSTWARLARLGLRRLAAVRAVADLNGWRRDCDRGEARKIIYHISGLRQAMRSSPARSVRQIKTYDFVNTLLLHGTRLICGMINGRVKIWGLGKAESDSNAAPVVLEGHTRSVFALSARRNVLVSASGGPDSSVRFWDLTTMSALRQISLACAATNCAALFLAESWLVGWYASEAIISRVHRPQGRLVMWNVAEESVDVKDSVWFPCATESDRVRLGDVGEYFSAVALRDRVEVFSHDSASGLTPACSVRLDADEWTYVARVFKALLVLVVRRGEEHTQHGLLDDVVQVLDARTARSIRRLEWKWNVFGAPLKSVSVCSFGLAAVSTSERAVFWHFCDLNEAGAAFDVCPSRQSGFVMQWRNKTSVAMAEAGVAITNEQRSHVYVKQFDVPEEFIQKT